MNAKSLIVYITVHITFSCHTQNSILHCRSSSFEYHHKMKLAFLFLIFLAATQVDASWLDKLKSVFNKDKADVDKVSSLIQFAHHAVKKVVSHAMNSLKKPKFCHDLECPPYEVVTKRSNYEKRCYPSAMWVATEAKAESGGMSITFSN